MEVQARHILRTACKAHWEQSWAKELVRYLLQQHGAHVGGTSCGSGLCGRSLRRTEPGARGGLEAVGRWVFS